MSDTITFGLATRMEVEEVLTTVERLWVGDALEWETPETGRETLRVHLHWYFGTEEEKRVGRSIARYLLECASDQRLVYYRESEMVEDAEDSGITLGVDEIFTSSYEPTMNERYKYSYTIVPGEADREAAGLPARHRFLFNPTSGGGRGGRLFGRFGLGGKLSEAGAQFEVSRSSDHLRELARQAVADRVERVVVVGGDGTVHYVIQELAGSETELAVVPSGRGDDFAMSLGVPPDVDAALELALNGTAREVDLVRVDRPESEPVWGGIYASFGFDSAVTRTGNSQPRWIPRSLTYIVAALRTLVGFEAPRFTVEHDGGRYQDRAMLVTACNAPIYGGGMRIAPAASMSDGLLDLVTVARVSKPTLLLVFPRVFGGSHVDHPAVSIVRTARARIRAEPPVLLGSDGEIEGEVGSEPVDVSVVPRALRAVAPAE